MFHINEIVVVNKSLKHYCSNKKIPIYSKMVISCIDDRPHKPNIYVKPKTGCCAFHIPADKIVKLRTDT